VEYSEFDRHPAYGRSDDRRRGDDRRGALRREADQAQRMREMAAFAIAMCGGLAVLYLFFVIIGTIDVGNAIAATVAALVLAAIWLFGFWRRLRTNATLVQRPDRERRGF
jgi:ABC-type transport system involved in cytochrome bd biosynthesis fused ATPase/permease subunit